MTRSVFYGFGAFVGSITGPTQCGWWPDDPAVLAWDPTRQIAVDLAKNPEAARRGIIATNEIQADDYSGYAHGGLTQIGPMWPGGRMTGACYLESAYYNGLANKPNRIPPGFQGRAYELTTVLYWAGGLAGRRFIGVHAAIKNKQGARALVDIWEPGTSQIANKPAFGTYWIDFGAHVHPIEPDFTEIGVGPTDPQIGAAFVDATVLRAVSLRVPKVPPYLGAFLLKTARRS